MTAVACSQGTLVSTGKDDMISVFQCKGGEDQYVTQIPLGVNYFASAIDVLDGRILIGHDNGKIQVVDVNGTGKELVNVCHHDGESWGLHVIEQNGTFLTCGDDNTIYEFSIKDKKCIKEGRIWTPEMNNGKIYETNKIRSTASTLSNYPV